MPDVYTYRLSNNNNLYINLTNRCTNACDFCIRNGAKGLEGNELWLSREPTAAEVIAEIGDASKYDEVVFCGFGEPILRLPELIEIARYVKSCGGRVRVNTNGQGNLIYGRSIAKELEGLVDTMSISINATSAEAYQKLCHSGYGEKAYDALLEFARECAEVLPEVVLSVVDVIGPEEIEKSAKIAESVGAKLRVRKYTEGDV